MASEDGTVSILFAEFHELSRTSQMMTLDRTELDFFATHQRAESLRAFVTLRAQLYCP